MSDEELLYREMNPEDPWYMGDDPNEEYDDDSECCDDEEESRRNAFMLFWNPADSNYTLDDYANDRKKYGKRFRMNWSVIWPENVQEGDRYYMVRIGEGRTGIVWNGTFYGEPFKDRDWKDKRRKRWFIPINVEDVKNGAKPPTENGDTRSLFNHRIQWWQSY